MSSLLRRVARSEWREEGLASYCRRVERTYRNMNEGFFYVMGTLMFYNILKDTQKVMICKLLVFAHLKIRHTQAQVTHIMHGVCLECL